MQDIRAFRDPGWEQRERSYHEVALKEVNSLVRKYNGVAPYAVRRPFYVRDVEMERVYESGAEEIWQELAKRTQETMSPHDMTPNNAGIESENSGEVGEMWSFADHIRKWVASIVSK